MILHLRIFWRAFAIVTVSSLNVTQVSAHRFNVAFFTGGLLSWIWWGNTRTAAHSDARFGRAAYSLGAACGTITGMWLGMIL